MLVKRELYLSRLREFYDSNLIKIIYGVRRSGKSEILKQIKQELLDSGVASDHIIYMNLEDLQYYDYLNAIAFNKFMINQMKDEEKYYILIDEIQMVDDFQRAINSLRATKNCSIFVTGSNAKILSGELATLLGGRYISIKVMPFVFEEVLSYMNEKNIDKQMLFNDYMKWGGMPQRFELSSESAVQAYLEDVISTILYKDIMLDQKKADKVLTMKILNYLYDNTGNLYSDNKVYNELSQSTLDLKKPKVYAIISRITDAMAISKCKRYDIQGKNILSLFEKYYAVDLGLKRAMHLNDRPNYGRALETIMYNELIARGYQVYVGKTYKGEVDFLVLNGDKRCYIQVSYLLNDDKVIEREFGAFKDITDNFPKYVVSLDQQDFSQNGITHINIIDLLSGVRKLDFL